MRRKLRLEPGSGGCSKTFRWQVPTGRSGWASARGNGNPGLLYHSELLPEARAADTTVWVVEGEKDADRASSLGLVAVCNPEGASRGGGSWKPSYTSQLAGLPVVIVADRDEVGRDHAQGVAAHLHGTAASVRVVELPGDGANDLSDWLAAQPETEDTASLADRLAALAGEAPEWAPGDAPDSPSDEAALGDSQPKAKPSQSEILLRLAESAGVELFHTPNAAAFARMPVGEHHEVHPVGSRAFRQWLLRAYYAETGKSPNAQARTDAVGTLEAAALFDGPEHPVGLRVAEHGSALYIDLGDPEWRVVEVTPEGWRVLREAPVRFRRAMALGPLPEPVAGGSLRELEPLINLRDEDSFVLLGAFLVSCFAPEMPFPVLVLHGEQGSAKSSLARTIASLVDPSEAPLRSAPRNEEDLIISATHRRLLAFDNLSGVRPWLSDALCRLSTGAGISKRQLYTDDDEVVLSAQRPMVLTGIDEVIGRGDLVDRSVILSLLPIADGERRTEQELAAELDRLRPRVFGALLTAVSCALGRREAVQLDRAPRMADFARWAVAAEPALPWAEGAFLRAYEGNRGGAVQATLDADEVATAVQRLVEESGSFEGTATELLAQLEPLVSETVRRSQSWPKSVQALSSRVRRAASFLRRVGIQINTDRSRSRRLIRIAQTTSASPRHPRHPRHEPQIPGPFGDEDSSRVTRGDESVGGETARDLVPGDEGDESDEDLHLLSKSPEDDPETLRL